MANFAGPKEKHENIRLQEHAALVGWFVIHVGCLAAVLYFDTDLARAYRRGDNGPLHGCLARLALVSFLYFNVKLSDPGYVSPSQRAASLEEAAPCCATCAAPQPPGHGVKHCRYCSRCVSGFDHHCVWLGNCVGRRNHGRFWLYLVVQSYVQAYGADLLLGACRTPPPGSAVHTRRLLATIALIIFLFIFFLFTCGLCAFHTYLALTGHTTRSMFGSSALGAAAAVRRKRTDCDPSPARGSGGRPARGRSTVRIECLSNLHAFFCGLVPLSSSSSKGAGQHVDEDDCDDDAAAAGSRRGLLSKSTTGNSCCKGRTPLLIELDGTASGWVRRLCDNEAYSCFS